MAIANKFNTECIKMGKILADEIKNNRNYEITRTQILNSFVSKPIDPMELNHAIFEFKSNRAVGLDDLKRKFSF